MPAQIDREGTFRGTIIEYSLFDRTSGGLALIVTASLKEAWDAENQAWEDWAEYDVQASGFLTLVTKEGKLNRKQTEALIKHTGWDGAFTSIDDESWQPTPCQFVIRENNYQGVKTFQIAFINGHDDEPGGKQRLTPERLKALSSQFGSDLRAIAGNVKRQESTPTGTPPAPPKKAEAPPMEPPLDEQEIPF